MREILFAGFGGQGVLTSGLVMSQVAVFKGQNATWIPSYGSAMRGGTANCTVKYGEGMIYNPAQEEPDLLLAMNGPSLQAFAPIVKPGGIILVNSDIVSEDQQVRDDVNVYRVACSTLAQEIGQPRGANIIMAAAVIKLLNDFSMEDGIQGMNDMFRKKGKEKFESGNVQSFECGYNAV
ncbi:2-oxoglutarate ferredoxin oxidoreductase subunit gamma [Paucidesulfovibrio gracilis DSM 16080]|uniref:2-oxoglutarate ferredoxin oxidoreductase subunit gamma n=1 Tax=Paucidesulfovibrio gracilis DSM 16080 TaxID=1121449 RepID=A0A1T4WYX5_9BACT|nr:2-oxoacid:acceptor oxidoreductase family protein [Paucidesulfovibrio gracilis]SKA82560.1 2-oxoglutarate ferredoxin oxidoreductase subunit gamma [Paucidesulfovibrio gracilis DSM 16080]